jgi:hypothetical protein
LKAFREKDLREFSWGSDKALKSADFTLVNEGTLVDHRRKAAEVIKKIITGANH